MSTLSSMTGYEDIDKIMRRRHSLKKRGDCFVEGRTVIVEQKEILSYKCMRKKDFHSFHQR